MGIIDHGTNSQPLSAPSLAAWAASVADILGNSDTPVNDRIAAAASNIVSTTALDASAGLVMKLDQRQPTAVMAVLGDSTGVPPTTGTWVGNLAAKIGAKWTACKVTTRLQSAGAYPAPTTVSAGVLSGVVAKDLFNRTAADLVGSSPDIGGVWSGTAGKYTLNGTQAVFANAGAGTSNRMTVTASGRLSTTVNLSLSYTSGATPAGQFQVLSSYVDSSNFLWVQLDNNTATITYKVSTTAGGTVNVSTFTYAAAGITVQPANRAVPIKIEHVADTVVFTVGTATYTYTLTAPQSATFATGTAVGFWGSTNNHTVEDITTTVAFDPATTLDIYNGSASSTDATWPDGSAGRLAALLPVAPDVVFINYGHNHLTETPAAFETKVDTLVTAVRARFAGTPIVIVGQNPEFAPATNRVAHNLREQDKRRYAKAKGYGYLAAFEALQGQDFPAAFVQADGVHPTVSGASDGGAVWATAADAYLKSISLKP